jgi:predicted CXXCH cytochrome family protein
LKFRLHWIFFVTIVGLSSVWPEDVPATEVAELFKCPVCHTDRLREYKRRRAVTLVPHEPHPTLSTGQQLETSTPEMCFSCHDGFVLDSRTLWKEGHKGHRVGMYPSEKITLPVANNEPVFPLNDDGRMYCGTCHSPHLIEDAANEAPPFMRVNPEDGQLCQACHDEKRSIAESDHVRSSGRRRKTPGDFEARGVCTRCHVAHEAKGPVLWSRELGEGNTLVNRLCTSCHEDEVHPSEHPNDIVAWSQNLRDGLGRTTDISMPVFDRHGLQGENGSIACPTCHNAHRQRAADLPADRGGKFLRQPNTEDFLCADCHGQSSLQRYLYFHTE